MERCVFEDKTENYVITNLVKNIVFIEKYNVDEKNGKLFVVMLKNAFNDAKVKGCVKYQQTIYLDDYEKLITKNDWEIIKKDDYSITLECDIDYAAVMIISEFMN